MSKEFEEKLFFHAASMQLPCSELHFASYASFIGVSTQDIERYAAQNGKILPPVIALTAAASARH